MYERASALLSLGLEDSWRRRLVERFGARDGERYLDVATGTGLVARELRSRARCDVVGIDLSPGMLAAAGRDDGVRLVLGRAEQLPFVDARFDGLTFTYLLRYVGDPAATLRELARVVRPGGTIASLEFHVPRALPLRLGWWLYTRLAMPLLGASIARPWVGVARFLAGSISAFYARHPLDQVEAMWRAAGIEDVRSDVLALGAAVVTWGRRASDGETSPPRLRPAFYALRAGGWRDYLTLLHPPYTVWHLSYVVLGAALAPALHPDRLVGTLVAFFLALGIGVHALDELNGRPLRTAIPVATLRALGALGLGSAVALGVVASTIIDPSLLVFVAIGVALALGYPLELAGGRLHSDLWFALGWGAFPLLTAYWAQALALSPVALIAASYAVATSYAQRRLSTWVRTVRRRATRVGGEMEVAGERRVLDASTLIAPAESALRWLALAGVVIALAALAARL